MERRLWVRICCINESSKYSILTDNAISYKAYMRISMTDNNAVLMKGYTYSLEFEVAHTVKIKENDSEFTSTEKNTTGYWLHVATYLTSYKQKQWESDILQIQFDLYPINYLSEFRFKSCCNCKSRITLFWYSCCSSVYNMKLDFDSLTSSHTHAYFLSMQNLHRFYLYGEN